MLRLLSKFVMRPNLRPIAPLGLQVKVMQSLAGRSHTIPVRRLASFTATDNRRYNRLEPRIERKLGEYENYLFKVGRDKGWAHIVQLLSVQSEKELSPENIKRAFANLQRRHAALRMAVISKDGENYFAEVPDEPDLEILQTTDSGAVMAREESKWFDSRQLLWRCKVLQPDKSDLGFLYPVLFVMQACINDGTALTGNLYPSLIDYLATSSEQNEYHAIDSLPLLPAREHLLDQHGAILDQQDAGQQSQIKNEISQVALSSKFGELHKPSNPKNCSGVVDFVLDEEKTSQLVMGMARQNVSLNSACVAANAMATYKFLMGLGADLGTISLPSPYVVELRRYAIPKHPTSHSGAFVTVALNNINLNAEMANHNGCEVLSKLASLIKKETTERLASNEPLFAIKKFLGFYERFQSDRDTFYRECESSSNLFYISNLGHVLIPAGNGSVTIKKIRLLKGAREPGIFGHNIMRLNGTLQWEISYSKMLVSDKLVETYLSLIKCELERFLPE